MPRDEGNMIMKKAAIYTGIVIILLIICINGYRTIRNQELFESRNEDNVEFLSNTYFYELDDLYKQVKSENEKIELK